MTARAFAQVEEDPVAGVLGVAQVQPADRELPAAACAHAFVTLPGTGCLRDL
jgi:hypothetical protein